MSKPEAKLAKIVIGYGLAVLALMVIVGVISSQG
jgi:hypothetical protein